MAVVKADGYGHGAVQLRQDGAELRGRVPGRGHGGRGHRPARGLRERPYPHSGRAPGYGHPAASGLQGHAERSTPPSSPSATPRPPTPSGCPRSVPPGGEHGHEPHRRASGRGGGVRATGERSIGRSTWWARSPTSPRPTAPAPSDFERQAKRFIGGRATACARPASTRASCTRRTPRPPSATQRCSWTWCASAFRCTDCYPCPEAYPMIDLKPAMSVKARITDVQHAAGGRGRELRPELPQPRQP